MAIDIDGSWGEGGGQILRTSLALSAITANPIRIFNIRAKRSPPGLRPQHKTVVEALAQITDAKVDGLRIGSTNIKFYPNKIKGDKFTFDTGTAASTSLIIQCLIPVIAFSPFKVSIEILGGTNNPRAPIFEYLQGVFLPIISNMGFKGSIDLVRRGFYPKGGGIVRAIINPIKNFIPITLTKFGENQNIYGLSYSCRLPPHIVKRMARSAKRFLNKANYKNLNIGLDHVQPTNKRCALDQGCGITLLAESSSGAVIGTNSLGKIGKPAEKVGQEAATSLIEQLITKAPFDKHMGDQLIIYISLAEGESLIRVSELTLHTLTCIHICEKIIGAKFKILDRKGKSATIMCKGINFKNKWI